MKTKLVSVLFVSVLALIGFYLRFWGLSENYSFWIDEFSSGQAASAIAKANSSVTVTGYFEARNLLSHYLMGVSMKIFGISEFSARLPSVIFGTFLIFVCFAVFRKIFNLKIALATTILTTFSVIEITWSRQARSYEMFQVFYLLSFYYIWKLIGKFKEESSSSLIKKIHLFDFLIPVLFFVLSFASHFLSISLLASTALFLLLIERRKAINIVSSLNKKNRVLGVLFFTLFAVIIWISGASSIFSGIFVTKTLPLKIYNNLWYYHSFLWRQYPLFTFLTLLGSLLVILNKNKKYYFILIATIVHLVLVVFFLGWKDTRYLFPIFPLYFFALSVYFLEQLITLFHFKNKIFKDISLFFLVLFIVANGYKFNFKPKSFYSPNADMKEIPLVDYNLIYGKIKNEILKTGNSVVIIDTWVDKVVWYLGRNYPNAYWIRSTRYIGSDGLEASGKIFDKSYRFRGITSKDELLEIIKNNKKGFILVDGHEVPFMPSDALSYIENNLKVQMKLNRFSLDPDPYDTWPVTLYSWGI